MSQDQRLLLPLLLKFLRENPVYRSDVRVEGLQTDGRVLTSMSFRCAKRFARWLKRNGHSGKRDYLREVERLEKAAKAMNAAPFN